jgi:hypothetical protein
VFIVRKFINDLRNYKNSTITTKKKKSEKSYFKLGLKVKGLETGGLGKNGLKNFKGSVVKKKKKRSCRGQNINI